MNFPAIFPFKTAMIPNIIYKVVSVGESIASQSV